MEFVEALDADTHEEVTEESQRIYCIAREKGKKQRGLLCQIIQ